MKSTSASARLALPDDGSLRGLRAETLLLLGSSFLLAAIGALTVHSASAELAIDYLPRQLVWIGIGAVVMLFAALFDYRFLLRYAGVFYGASLLAVLIISLFGHEAGGARSWVGLFGLGGQPTDMAKLATALLLARLLSAVHEPMLPTRQLVIGAIIVAVPMALVVAQPDLGGAIMFTPLLAATVLVGGVSLRTLLRVGVLLIAVGGLVFAFGLRDFQRDRILTFVSPERDPLGAGYQVRQSKIAVGSGGTSGKGYMQGSQSKLRFLPARHTDFVFAVLAEEWGFAGVFSALMLYLTYLGAGLKVALDARDRAGLLLATGLLSVLTVHVLYNTSMVIGLVPITGIPLPFLSYGGSFTLFCFFATGLLLAIDSRRYVNR